MATLTTSTGSLPLHRDIRSESRGYKRDKDHNQKWAAGYRARAGVKTIISDPTSSAEQKVKARPEKKMSEMSFPAKDHSNTLNTYMAFGTASGRIARKADARAEISSPNTLSRSLAEVAPHNSPIKQARSPCVDAGILYSFDAKSSPRNGVGLDSLVEKAELEWSNRETVKLVKNEYEILDASGEITVMKEGKKGKKNSPKQRPQLILANDEEDDWERI